jgi:hypothetical protein
MASQLRFGAFLTDHFGDDIVAMRRGRERAAEQALSASNIPVAEVEPATLTSEPPQAAEPVYTRRRDESELDMPLDLGRERERPTPRDDRPTLGRIALLVAVLAALAALGYSFASG